MSGPQYDPLPLTSETRDNIPYNPPFSPGVDQSAFPTPEAQPLQPHEDDLSSTRPRFLGRALRDESPQLRESYLSSGSSLPLDADKQSSVYGLNPQGGASTPRDSAYYSNLQYRDDPTDAGFTNSQVGVDRGATPNNPYLSEKREAYDAPRAHSRRRWWLIGALAVAAVVIVAVIVPVYFTVIKPHQNNNNSVSGSAAKGDDKGSQTSSSSAAAAPFASTSAKPTQQLAVTGGDGSTVTMEDGTTFTYSNSFGGYWYWDEADPFNNGARAQSWSPALNETFKYGVDKIRGVNLGGWLNTEPFIAPALYEKYNSASIKAVDEWTLSQNMAADTASGGLNQLEDHYKTFITEQDFAQIAGAGLNWVRIPLPYWAIEVRDGEPFLAKTCWTYFLKAIQWARKYGIRINLDLHAVPGSQNGWNHSGRSGSINFLNGPMGYANAQRSLDYIRIIAEFISQPQYKDVVAMFGIINEPQAPKFGQENLARFYMQAYDIVRTASGVGEGDGPFISFHEGFKGLQAWVGYFPNADRTSLDTHPYLCFNGQTANGYDSFANTPCSAWAAHQNDSMTAYGLTSAGEFSNAINDCGLWLNGVDSGARYDGTFYGTWPKMGSCDQWTDYAQWDDTLKAQIKQFALASMDALQNYFFWTWKIGNSSVTGKIESPAWSYQLGLQEGWMPTDPRAADGVCGNTDPFTGPLAAWQTGGAGAGQIPASFTSEYAWPPTTIANAGSVTLLPSYTPTGAIPTLAAPTFTSAGASASAGSGWNNAADNAGVAVPIPTCSYLDPWVGDADPPSPLCSGDAARRDTIPEPTITPAP